MGIETRFTDSIDIQSVSTSYDGTQTFTTRGTCSGYVKMLKYAERVTLAQQTVFATHKFTMDLTVVPKYGEYLKWNGSLFAVKIVDNHPVSGDSFQTVDAEIIT